ncbi:MAG: MerR family transcriptional regulator [Gammaproteobacteria bacterium]|nr:MerR family transcriptional regulator [Gammaproteobacteria bacterium]
MNQETINIDQDSDLERFPIRVLAEKTTVGTSTLRAWERRYGLLHPERTPKGHRLYSHLDVKRVLKILDLLNDGHSLPAISDILSAENTSTESFNLYNTENNTASPSISNTAMATIWDEYIKSTLDATADFNIERIDGIYNEASSLYPVDMVTDRLIQPAIAILGNRWKEHPEGGVAEEHFYTSWLKNRLGARFHHAYSHARGARIICACVPGSFHEIGLMLFALSALARGYRVLYFGADLPLDQLPYITQRSAAKAVVLGAQTQMDKNANKQLAALAKELKTPVFIGGSDKLIETEAFQASGGILLGSNISVALKVFESHVSAYSAAQDTTSHNNSKTTRE